MKILLINSGSSSLKFTFADVDTSTEIVASGLAEFSQNETAYQFEHGDNKNKSTLNTIDYGKVVGQILEDLKTHLGLTPEIVGHRVVHGGDFKKPEVITPEIEKRIDELAELAPLHNPFALNAIRSIKAILPTVTQFAVFDTAFHSTIPDHARHLINKVCLEEIVPTKQLSFISAMVVLPLPSTRGNQLRRQWGLPLWKD